MNEAKWEIDQESPHGAYEIKATIGINRYICKVCSKELAHLIAASPEMYRKLEQLSVSEEVSADERIRIRDLLKKARGEE